MTVGPENGSTLAAFAVIPSSEVGTIPTSSISWVLVDRSDLHDSARSLQRSWRAVRADQRCPYPAIAAGRRTYSRRCPYCPRRVLRLGTPQQAVHRVARRGIEILAKGPANLGERHIVDRRAGHARLDPLEIGRSRNRASNTGCGHTVWLKRVFGANDGKLPPATLDVTPPTSLPGRPAEPRTIFGHSTRAPARPQRVERRVDRGVRVSLRSWEECRGARDYRAQRGGSDQRQGRAVPRSSEHSRCRRPRSAQFQCHRERALRHFRHRIQSLDDRDLPRRTSQVDRRA